ncbi:MAG: hypothetical protein RL577_890 [Bacteroidota bacterium]
MSPKPNHIAIIGAGLAGCSLALELEKRGWSPLLVHDAQRLSSSDVAAGLINPIVPKGVRMTWNWEKMFPGWKTYYQQWESYLGSSFAETLPLHQLHRHADHDREWRKQMEKAVYQDFIQPIIHDLPSKSQVLSGHSVNQAGRLNVQAFCKATRDHFKKKGNLLESRFEENPSSAPLILPNGQKVVQVVYCQGIEMMDNPLWQWLPMHPTGGDILRVHIADAALGTKAIWKSKEWLVPIQNNPNEWLLGSNFHKGNRSQTPDPQDAEDLLNRVSEWLGTRPVLLEHKRSVRPTVGSRRPYLGRHPMHEHLYVFNGLGSKGSALVSWLAPVMADFITQGIVLPEEVNITRYWSDKNSLS